MFSCYAGRHWAIHVCMFHPFRVHDFLLCRSPLGDSCTCVCVRSTRFEMRKVLLASTEANKIFGGCAADRRPLEQKYPHNIKTLLGLKLHIACLVCSFMFFNVAFQNSSGVSGLVGLSNDGGGLIL